MNNKMNEKEMKDNELNMEEISKISGGPLKARYGEIENCGDCPHCGDLAWCLAFNPSGRISNCPLHSHRQGLGR